MLHNVTQIPACNQPRCLIFIAFTWDWELRMGCDRISFFVRYLGSPNALLPDDVLPLCLDYTALHQALEKHSMELVDFSRLSCLIWSNYDHRVFFNNDAIWLCLTNHHWFKIQLKFIFAFLAGGAVRGKWVEMFKTKTGWAVLEEAELGLVFSSCLHEGKQKIIRFSIQTSQNGTVWFLLFFAPTLSFKISFNLVLQ